MFNIWECIPALGNIKKRDIPYIESISIQSTYIQRLFNDIIGMIQYEDMPDGFDPFFHELYRYTYGVCGVTKRDDGQIISFIGGHSGEVGPYGLGKRFIGTTPDSYDYDFVINEGGVICKNNRFMSPDLDDIYLTAEVNTELYKSIRACIRYARATKTISTANNKVKKAIDAALTANEAGAPTTFVSEIDPIDREFSNADFTVLDLTDVNISDKLQYLFKAIDDNERQFYRHYGISLATTSKMAQQSREELTNTNALAMIYALERLNCAKEFCDDLNKLYGTNMTCHFSEIWELEYQKYISEIKNMKDGGQNNDDTIQKESVDGGTVSESPEEPEQATDTDKPDTESDGEEISE